MKKADKALAILNAAESLFLEQGYRNTSMREIVARSNVSLGLVSYYYKSKYDLAKACIQREFQTIERMVNSAVDFDADPLLYHALYLRVTHWYFMRPHIQNFYYECLEEGAYGDYICGTIPRTLRAINTKYRANYSDDYVLLYGNYLPTDLEKTLILQKRKGLFAQILEDDIPTIVFETAVSHFVADKSLVWTAVQKSITIYKEIVKQCDSQIY